MIKHNVDAFTDWITQRKNSQCHRQLLLITGEKDWVQEQLDKFDSLTLSQSSLLIGSEIRADNKLRNKDYRYFLGQEFDNIVIDGFSGIRANTLFALSGAIKRNGLMVLLAPSLPKWSQYQDPEITNRQSYGFESESKKSLFIEWLKQNIKQDTHVCILEKSGFNGQNILALQSDLRTGQTQSDFVNLAQKKAVDLILNTYNKKPNKFQVVIEADRGRGKSSAIGIAVGKLMEKNSVNVLVTALNIDMTKKIFEHAKNVDSESLLHKGTLSLRQSKLAFKPFDEILLASPKVDLLIIEEAASIPYPVLHALMQMYPQIILCTTIHGYEGSGKGFELRVKPYLNTFFPNWTTIKLEQPIRWFENDPLEHFWNRVMLAFPPNDAKYRGKVLSNINQPSEQKIKNSSEKYLLDITSLKFKRISSELILASPVTFYQIFDLLTNAHYQTSPDDLVRMLEAKDMQIFTLADSRGRIRAVALTAIEGGSTLAPIAEQISNGLRRVSGHLTAQRLAFAENNPTYATLSYLRIIRIAVQHDLQLNGIGSILTREIKKWANLNQINFLSTSFGVTPNLLNFWLKNDFFAVRIGLKRDASSGEFSILMLSHCENCHDTNFSRELNYGCLDNVDDIVKDKGSVSTYHGCPSKALIEDAEVLQAHFLEELAFQKDYRLKTLDYRIFERIFKSAQLCLTDNTLFELTLNETNKLIQFAQGYRPLYSCELALLKLLKQTPVDFIDTTFLESLLIDKLPYSDIATKFKLTGKKQIESKARDLCQALLSKYNSK